MLGDVIACGARDRLLQPILRHLVLRHLATYFLRAGGTSVHEPWAISAAIPIDSPGGLFGRRRHRQPRRGAGHIATGAYGQLPRRDFNPLDLLLLLRTVCPLYCAHHDGSSQAEHL